MRTAVRKAKDLTKLRSLELEAEASVFCRDEIRGWKVIQMIKDQMVAVRGR